jgi:hypothetical protein
MVARLDETLRAEAPGASIALAAQESAGRVYHEISWAGGNDAGTVAYSFVEGYLVAASSRELVDRAIETRASQYSLLDAPDVTRLMPVDRQIHFSGLLYQDVGSVLAPLAGAVSQADDRLSPEEQQMVAEMSADLLSPTLVGFYGEEDSVRLVGTTQGGLLGGVFDRLLGAGQLLEMGRRLESPEEDPPR